MELFLRPDLHVGPACRAYQAGATMNMEISEGAHGPTNQARRAMAAAISTGFCRGEWSSSVVRACRTPGRRRQDRIPASNSVIRITQAGIKRAIRIEKAAEATPMDNQAIIKA